MPIWMACLETSHVCTGFRTTTWSDQSHSRNWEESTQNVREARSITFEWGALINELMSFFALFLYLGLGLASSYIDPYKIWIGCSAGAATPCCGCGGGGSLSLIEAEAGATGAIYVECVDWKFWGDNSNCQRKNRKSRAVQSGILLRSIYCSILHALLPPQERLVLKMKEKGNRRLVVDQRKGMGVGM